jgi:predicted nucleic acid-binding protein
VDRVFLDANVLFSVAYAPDSRLRGLWSLPGIELVTSEFAWEEARRNLLSYRPEGLSVLDEVLSEMTIVPSVLGHLTVADDIELPDKDQPIVWAAAAARCTHLLTGDRRHFGAMYGRRIAGVLVLTPAQYLRRRGRRR